MTPTLRHYADPAVPLLYEDPPELSEYAARKDLPMEYWPGEWKTKYDVMRACGDPRDWFRFWWRYEAYCQAWANFLDARRRRRNLFSGFDWNQVLIIGPYGTRKSTLMVYKAKLANDVGHPCFSNATLLFGWGLGHVELYTAMGFCPKCSVMPIDESAASLSSRLGHGVAISTFNEMALNTRKQNAQVMLCGAQDWNVAASVRAGCREVWRPLDQDSLQIERRKPLNAAMVQAAEDPASDPDNFILAWDVWNDFPYNKQDLIDGKPDDQTFGPPDYTVVAEGEEVRNAFLLNDSFQLAHAGAATVTDRNDVKDFLGKYHEMLAKLGAGPDLAIPGAARAALEQQPSFPDQIFAEVLALRDEEWGRKFIKPKDIAERVNSTPQKVNSVLSKTMQDVEYTSNGYRTAEVFGWIAKMLPHMTSNFSDPTEHGGPAALLREMAKQLEKYGPIKPLPERGKGSETRISRDETDLSELYRKLGYSMPIAQMAEMSGKYQGYLRDGNVTELDEKAAIQDALAIHRMIITSECAQRKKRYEDEENEVERCLSKMAAERRPIKFHFDPYLVTNADADAAILKDYLESLQEDHAALQSADEDDAEEESAQVVIPEQRGRGRPPKPKPENAGKGIPLVEDLVNKWGACDAFMFQVLLDEERHGIDYAEQHYDTYEKIERIKRDTEFMAALLPPDENAYFWCRVRQMGIIRERSYDVAMGFPTHDFSDVVDQISAGRNIHDLAHQLDWSFNNAYRRVMGSMLDGKEYRLTLTSLIAQQVPLSPQVMQMMQQPPGGFWQGQPWAQQPGAAPPGEEPVQDNRSSIFSFVKKNQGGQEPPQKNTRRRRRAGSS